MTTATLCRSLREPPLRCRIALEKPQQFAGHFLSAVGGGMGAVGADDSEDSAANVHHRLAQLAVGSVQTRLLGLAEDLIDAGLRDVCVTWRLGSAGPG